MATFHCFKKIKGERKKFVSYRLFSMKLSLLTASMFLLIAGGCARLNYVKVPTPTQYSNWSDEQQKKVDKMKGVRYYLPRPFLHLKQSVPVAQRVAFISFHYDENTKGYVVDKPENAPSWLKKVLPEKLSVTQALALTLSGREQEQKAGEVKEEAGIAGEAETGEKPKEQPQPEAKPPSELHAQTGFINATDPVTRLGDRMDVVYLPDFEEQYIIQPHTGLGSADIETKLRNGWAAEVFSNKVDNSNLIPYVINQFERASDVASGIVTTWAPMVAGIPSPAISKLLRPPGPKLEGVEAGAPMAAEEVKDFLGNMLLFKVAEVKIAQPGLYPILKPREIRQWLKFNGIVTGPDEDIAFSSFLLQSQAPWIRQDMAFIPCPPFTMIAFNATTDVFLMPASNRLAELDTLQTPGKNGTSSEDDENRKKTTQTLDNIEAKLNDTLENNFDAALASVFKGRIKAKDERNVTKITITNLNHDLTPQEKDESKFKKWVKVSLSIPGDELIHVKFIDRGIEITIDLPIAELL